VRAEPCADTDHSPAADDTSSQIFASVGTAPVVVTAIVVDVGVATWFVPMSVGVLIATPAP
jgi:hypothetical protein